MAGVHRDDQVTAGTLDQETLMRVAFAVIIVIVLSLPDPASAQVVSARA